MGIIKGEVPQPLPSEGPRQVVMKLRPGAAPPAAGETLARWRGAREALSSPLQGLSFAPFIEEDTVRSAERKSRAAEATGAAGARGEAGEERPRSAAWSELARYYAADLPPGVDGEEVARALRALEGVESAYVPGGPTPPPVNPGDDPRSTNQGYLDAAPHGIDARWAWSVTDGLGVGVVDLERGWTLNHEDLAGAGITIISGQSQDYHGHGTAVLGELVGVDNTLGVVGIAPRASARVVSQWRTFTSYNTAAAIASAAAAMAAGDVLLLEAQTSHVNATGYVPVEVEDAVFDAIRAATDDGIIVVEAGANGSVDLDGFTNSAGKRILNRSHADFRDSGAIVVGAGSSTAPHTRLSFSNFGSRVDCYAWGQGIETTGDGWTGTSTTAYTSSFGGTSGASPIVTGAAVLLQSWGQARGRPYGPSRMRSLLSNASLNTPSAAPVTDRIGVMPNLRAIIESESMRWPWVVDRWRLVARILFGVSNDGGGVIWVPGRGPIPIDPWGPLHLEAVTPEVRNAMAAMAVHELAGLSADPASARAMRKSSVAAIKRAADQLAAQLDGKR